MVKYNPERKKVKSFWVFIMGRMDPVECARGEVSFDELKCIHNKMETLLGLDGAYIDGIYFCPHHPNKGYEGEVPELKFNCECRKPKPGMLLKAAEDFNIDLSQSIMVGDGKNDILAGKAAGCKTVLLNGAGTSGADDDYGADVVADSLSCIDITWKR